MSNQNKTFQKIEKQSLVKNLLKNELSPTSL